MTPRVVVLTPFFRPIMGGVESNAERLARYLAASGFDVTVFGRQAQTMLDAIEGRAPVLCGLAEARHTLDVNLAILRSAERRAWEMIKPVAGTQPS